VSAPAGHVLVWWRTGTYHICPDGPHLLRGPALCGYAPPRPWWVTLTDVRDVGFRVCTRCARRAADRRLAAVRS